MITDVVVVTVEQARRELERRRGSPEQKAKGRAQAMADGTLRSRRRSWSRS